VINNYLKIAFRSLTKYRLFAAINVPGLSVGIAFSLLTGVCIIQEKINPDLKNMERKYIVKNDWKINETGLDITTGSHTGQLLQVRPPASGPVKNLRIE